MLMLGLGMVRSVSAAGVSAPSGEVQLLVARYFQSASADARSALAERIEHVEGVTLEAVAAAVRSAQLWDARAPGFDTFDLMTERGTTTKVHIHVPETYDPARGYPLLLAFHGQDGDGAGYLRFALRLLGDRMNEFIVAAPTRLGGCFIGSPPVESSDPVALFRALKARYHIDTDRIYASGYSKGGHQSFLLGLLYPDILASAVPLAGTFATQVGLELVDLMLPNLQRLPMLVVYGELDRGQPGGRIDDRSGISGANRYIKARAKALDVPIGMMELKGVGHGGVTPPAERFHEMLSKVRTHHVKRIEHRFRYQPQGRIDWLRQTRFQGAPWKGEHIRVKPKGEGTYSDALVRKLKSTLPAIGGSIEGQEIRIRTRRCSEIELLLNDELVDMDLDIAVYLKGRIVFRGRPTPRITTLLDVAYEDWEFQGLYWVRYGITREGEIEER